jgi:hypothetical protein
MNAMTEIENLQSLHAAESFIDVRGVKISVTEIIPFKKGGHHPLALLDKIIEALIAKNETPNEDAIYGVIAKIVASSFDPESKIYSNMVGTLTHCTTITKEQLDTCNIAQVTDLVLKIVEVNISFFTEAVSKITAMMSKVKA